MVAFLRWLLPLVVLVAAAPLVSAQDQAANPYSKFWSRSKPAATVVLKETTRLSGPAADRPRRGPTSRS
jgi:hypothetical protein